MIRLMVVQEIMVNTIELVWWRYLKYDLVLTFAWNRHYMTECVMNSEWTFVPTLGFVLLEIHVWQILIWNKTLFSEIISLYPSICAHVITYDNVMIAMGSRP